MSGADWRSLDTSSWRKFEMMTKGAVVVISGNFLNLADCEMGFTKMVPKLERFTNSLIL